MEKNGICNTDKGQDEWVKGWLLGRSPKDNRQQRVISERDFSLTKSSNERYWSANSWCFLQRIQLVNSNRIASCVWISLSKKLRPQQNTSANCFSKISSHWKCFWPALSKLCWLQVCRTWSLAERQKRVLLVWGRHLQHTETLGKTEGILREGILIQPEAKLHNWKAHPSEVSVCLCWLWGSLGHELKSDD